MLSIHCQTCSKVQHMERAEINWDKHWQHAKGSSVSWRFRWLEASTRGLQAQLVHSALLVQRLDTNQWRKITSLAFSHFFWFITLCKCEHCTLLSSWIVWDIENCCICFRIRSSLSLWWIGWYGFTVCQPWGSLKVLPPEIHGHACKLDSDRLNVCLQKWNIADSIFFFCSKFG